jgi:hypothetical protein
MEQKVKMKVDGWARKAGQKSDKQKHQLEHARYTGDITLEFTCIFLEARDISRPELELEIQDLTSASVHITATSNYIC